MNLRTDLKRVRGLGSANDGTHHWWWQRLTALALVPLLIWFMIGLLSKVGAPHSEVVAWIASPLVTSLMIAMVAALFYHLQLGMQVVIEDYVHTEWTKITLQILLRFAVALCTLIAIIAILRIAFGAFHSG